MEPKDLKLYEIPRQFEDAMIAGVDHETGEVTDAMAGELDALDMAFDDKADACIHSHLRQLGIVASCRAEIKRVQDIKARAEKKAEGVRVYLENCMASMGRESVGDAIHGAKFKKTPTKVDADSINMDILPMAYKRFKQAPAPEPDKKKLLDDFKTNALPDIDGLKFIEGARKLTIK